MTYKKLFDEILGDDLTKDEMLWELLEHFVNAMKKAKSVSHEMALKTAMTSYLNDLYETELWGET